MRLNRVVVVLPALLMCVVSCSDDDAPSKASAARAMASSSAPEPSSAPATSSAPAWTGPRIPDGAYSKTVTRAEAKAAEVADFVFGDFGNRDSVTYTYKFSGDRFTIFVARAGGIPEPGEAGTLSYAPGKEVTMAGESEACAPCVYTYRWRLGGKSLHLTLVGHESSDGPKELAATRFVTEGVFERQP